jgi:hypothetical protein
MSTNRLNRGGPLSFSQITIGTPHASINSLLANVEANVPTQNISLSASLTKLKGFAGDPINNTKNDQGIGVGLVSYNNVSDVKMSEFYGANYLSASIKPLGDGVWYAEFYPDSTVYNANYLTEETSSRIYRYSIFSKPNPPGSAEFTKQVSYVLANDSEEYFSNLTANRIYKVVLKDVVSNAFTSSFFTGSCTEATTSVGSSVQLQSSVSLRISNAVTDIIQKINSNNTLCIFQKNDLVLLVNELPKFISNPRNYNLDGYTRSFTKPYPIGGTRTFSLQGCITKLDPSGNFYSGIVSCTGGTNAPVHKYAVDEMISTTGQSVIRLFALANSTTIGVCEQPPTRSVSNTAAVQDCFCNAQTTCVITDISQVHYTGSFWITNPNDEPVTVTLMNDWVNINNNKPLLTPNGQLIPSFLMSPFSLNPNESRKIPISFGNLYWGQPVQSSSFSAKGTFTMEFTDPTQTLTGYITANWNKAVCVPSSTGGGGSGGCPASWMLMETLEHGFIPAKDIEVGMHLRGPEYNEWNEVTLAYEAHAPIWRTTIDGDVYDVDDSHLWYLGNGVWKCVKYIITGDKIEGSYGQSYTVDSNELLMPTGSYMHLNCNRQRFLMNGKVVGHNAVKTTTTVRKF